MLLELSICACHTNVNKKIILVFKQILKRSLALFLVRNELKGKAAELDTLTDTLVNEQKKSRELQWALEKEKTKTERSEERRKEELEVTDLGT